LKTKGEFLFHSNGTAINRALVVFFQSSATIMTEVDLFTQFLTSKAISQKLADICHKTAELLQSTLSLTLMEITILLCSF